MYIDIIRYCPTALFIIVLTISKHISSSNISTNIRSVSIISIFEFSS